MATHGETLSWRSHGRQRELSGKGTEEMPDVYSASPLAVCRVDMRIIGVDFQIKEVGPLPKRTPLYDVYQRYGGKTIDFGGWDLPVQYTGILAEHEAVRTRAGLFDVSHMGELDVSGPDALSFLQNVATNDVSRLADGQALYTPLCNERGGTVDDVLIYRFTIDHYLVVVNAANIDKDFEWFTRHSAGAQIVNRSADIAQLALQGPLAQTILTSVADPEARSIAYYHFRENILVAGIPCLVSRTGYTGEDGFELYAAAEDAAGLFIALLEAGADAGLLPVGLGARDTLRLEARLPLYGHELADDISPLEAGLAPFVKLDKPDFIGKAALEAQKREGVARKLMGFVLQERGIARAGHQVSADGRAVGAVTSGTMSPTLRQSIGLTLMERAQAEIGRSIAVDIRGKEVPGVLVKTPFYRRGQ